MLIEKAVSRGFLTGLKVLGGEGKQMQISHLLFADDTLVFYNDKKDQMVYLSWILVWLEAFSSQKINFEKSSILPMGRVENLEELAEELGCISRMLREEEYCILINLQRRKYVYIYIYIYIYIYTF